MDKIWANRIIAGTKTLNDVPDSRKEAVKNELYARMEAGELTYEAYNAIFDAEVKTEDW